MKLRGCAAGAFLLFAGIVVACSSKAPAEPPIDTSGSTSTGQGGGSSSATAAEGGADAGASEDAASDATNLCLSNACLGCCTATNECLPGNLNSACGFNNGRCTTCSGTQTCIAGSGCE